jgi:hypothetical protein
MCATLRWKLQRSLGDPIMSDETVTFHQLADRLKNADVGMHISIPGPSGYQPVLIEPNELEAALKDRDAFIARYFGVTKGHYLSWIEFVRNPQCMAKTRKGRQCQHSYFLPEYEYDRPDKFDPNCHYFCHSHREYAEAFKDFKRRA